MQTIYGFQAASDAFSVGTLIYARLRRLSGRVVDVVHLMENLKYAEYVVQLAFATEDTELSKLALRLQSLIEVEQAAPAPPETVQNQNETAGEVEEYRSEATEDEIYKAQVSHHYIGALR